MKILNSKIVYKLLVTIMIIITLMFFIIATPTKAALNDQEFQYYGTTKGTFHVVDRESFWEKLVNALAEIADWLLGIMTMGVRIVFIGWTALIELTLSSAVKSTFGNTTFGDEFKSGMVFNDGIGSGVTNASTKMDRDKDIITIESIVFNRVPILDINIFRFEMPENVTVTGIPIEPETQP